MADANSSFGEINSSNSSGYVLRYGETFSSKLYSNIPKVQKTSSVKSKGKRNKFDAKDAVVETESGRNNESVKKENNSLLLKLCMKNKNSLNNFKFHNILNTQKGANNSNSEQPIEYNKTLKIKLKLDDKKEKPFSCTLCEYKCSQKTHLDQHMKIHTREKPFSCEFCGYKCAQRCHLDQHKRTHTRVKPFSCDFCDYKCAQKSHLDQHIRTHTGVKPFSCNFCYYKCVQRSHLDQHVRRHTVVKPFSCKFCDYKCIQQSQLNNHSKTHGSKPYSCNICDYECTKKRDLIGHQKIHSDIL